MNTLNSKSFREIQTWMHRNARAIELSIWQCLFENESKEAVISALAFYQNEDGGFGNALEADFWNPESSPYTTLHALNILKSVGFEDAGHPVIRGAIRFLGSGKYFSNHHWLFNIPSNNNYPHAPWWTYDETANETESIGLTAGIAAFILRHARREEALYQTALDAIDRLIGKLFAQDRFGDMGLGGYCELLEAIKETGIAGKYDYPLLLQTVKRLASESIERDDSKWVYYGVRPSNYIHSPDNVFYKDNEDIVQKELDYLIETKPEGGVWGIPWSWFENNEKYAKEFAVSENWWKAYKGIEKTVFLRNFGRLE